MAETKWLLFRRRYFEVPFLEWKVLKFKQYFEICSLRTIWQYVITGSGNGLVSSRQQANIWTNNNDPTQRRIYASPNLISWVISSEKNDTLASLTFQFLMPQIEYFLLMKNLASRYWDVNLYYETAYLVSQSLIEKHFIIKLIWYLW